MLKKSVLVILFLSSFNFNVLGALGIFDTEYLREPMLECHAETAAGLGDVFEIRTSTSMGSGFMIEGAAGKQYVMTAAHVLEGQSSASAVIKGEEYPIAAFCMHKVWDGALFGLVPDGFDLAVATLGEKRPSQVVPFKIGTVKTESAILRHKSHFMNTCLSKEGIPRRYHARYMNIAGYIKAKKDLWGFSQASVLQTKRTECVLPVYGVPGDSGSPLINDDGEAVGLFYGIRPSVIKKKLAEISNKRFFNNPKNRAHLYRACLQGREKEAAKAAVAGLLKQLCEIFPQHQSIISFDVTCEDQELLDPLCRMDCALFKRFTKEEKETYKQLFKDAGYFLDYRCYQNFFFAELDRYQPWIEAATKKLDALPTTEGLQRITLGDDPLLFLRRLAVKRLGSVATTVVSKVKGVSR